MATWIRLNDNFPDHPKAIGLSDKAFRVYITSMCYSGQYLTDGLVPMVAAGKFANGDIGIIKELILSGLWIDDVENDGVIIHKFLEFNASNEAVEIRKEQLKAAKARHKEKKALELSVKDDSSGIIKESIQNQSVISPPTHTPAHTPAPEVLKDLSKINEPIFSPETIVLGEFFADSLESIGCKRPTITKAWLTDLDKMIRLDQHTPEQIRAAITWAHADDFWAGNILSPKSLRAKYEQLRLKATAQTRTDTGPTKSSQKARALLELGNRLDGEQFEPDRLEINQ